VCQFLCRLLQVVRGQAGQHRIDVLLWHVEQITIDLCCQVSSEGEATGLDFFHAVSLQGQDGGSGAACATPSTVLVVAEDRNLTVFHFTRGEIVAQGRIVSCLPIDHQSTGNIVSVSVELLSEICLALIPSTETLIATFDVIYSLLVDESIYSIVTDCFTTTAILFIIGDEIIFAVLINELQHVIQSVVIFEQVLNELYGLSLQGLGVVRGESDAHVVCLVDSVSMAPLGGVWGDWWTVRGLSHAVEHVVDRIDVVCLSLKGPPMDGAGVVCLRGGCLAGLLALGDDLLSVGVVCHAVSLQGQGRDARGGLCHPLNWSGEHRQALSESRLLSNLRKCRDLFNPTHLTLRVIVTLFFEFFHVCYSGGVIIEQTQGGEVFPFIIPSTDDSVGARRFHVVCLN
jgi:hypothetical protein